MTVCLLFDIYSYHYDIYTFFFNDTPTTEIYTLSLHDALPIYPIRLPIAVKISRRRSRRINQVITDDIEVDGFRRRKGDVGILARTAKRILHIRLRLRAGRALPITEVAIGVLIEIDDPASAAIDREIACAARREISDTSRGPTEQVLWAEIAPADI